MTKYPHPPNMHKVGLVVGLLFVLAFSTNAVLFYQTYSYPLDQIADHVDLASLTTSPDEKTLYLYEGLEQLQPYTGNPEFFYPTDYTNYDELKTSVSAVITETSSLTARTTNADMSAQQYIVNINDSITSIHDRIHNISSVLGFNPTLNPVGYVIGIAGLLSIPTMLVLDRTLQERFYERAQRV